MSRQTETQTDVVMRGSAARDGRMGLVVIFSELAALPRPPALREEKVVGRDPELSSWAIDDAKVSRRHASLRACRDGVAIRDLGSRNGVFVDGVRLTDASVAPPGAIVRLGRSLFFVSDDVERYSGFPPAVLVGPLLGGPSLDEVRRTIRRVAPSKLSILIEGETGSGKELAARMIHRASAREGPLVSVNCAAIPRELVESELFGHEEGAFSGTRGARDGLFRRADRGTLFLDEVAELPVEVQPKLLRVVEDLHVRPVGSDRAIAVDVRVIAATNRDLGAMTARGKFREDLLHRLAAVRLPLPPLRSRREDIPLIAQELTKEAGLAFSVAAMESLCLGPHTGNVRNLKSRIQRAIVNAQAEGRRRIASEDVPGSAAPGQTPARAVESSDDDIALRARLETALRLHRGNVSRVGRDLAISRSTLYELLKRLAIDPGAYR